MRAIDIYLEETGNKPPDNQIAYHEWHIKYVNWLEQQTIKLFATPIVSKQCLHCLYRKYRPNAKHKYEQNQCQISKHNLTDIENYSCEHYKKTPNVC